MAMILAMLATTAPQQRIMARRMAIPMASAIYATIAPARPIRFKPMVMET